MLVRKTYIDTVIAHDCFISKLDEVLSKLVSVVSKDANEIWLFGSAARGDAHALSDLDIIVMGDWENPEQRRQVSLKIEMADLREDVGFIPVDIIVRTQKFLESNELFAKMVQQDKKVLWRNTDV